MEPEVKSEWADVWIPLPAHLIRSGDKLGIIVDEDLVKKVVRQYLHTIRRTRRYKEKMRTDPKTRDQWYKVRREQNKRSRKKKKREIAAAGG